ncbi:mitogen-activated protein kinase kinase kinase 2-like [Tripterygium wilfordii]|uniref:mitogen-activated protein kinase kinase kinase 2-like n=1 Tax=Tripterygium wilfordii TaxID=458696 RepID=UPI0018F81740|nr:mitogen-activated protein kinase kinase kinase 2-like [Tripterygium wilfordii]
MKPDNILLVPSNRNCDSVPKFVAKIADFGLAKRGRKSKRTRYDRYLRGTAMYMAPEVVLDHVQEAPADIWALGCLVLEMLTGKSPWDSEFDFAMKGLFRRIGDSGALPQIPAWISDDAREFLNRCFVRNPMFRFTTEMLMDLPFVSGVVEEEDEDDYHDDEVAENSDLLLWSEDPEEWRSSAEKFTVNEHKRKRYSHFIPITGADLVFTT